MPTDSPVSLNPFLKNVHLKGFKSITDLSTHFEPGLNILIGKNASGKSNFLEFLNIVTRVFRNQKVLYNYAEIEYVIPDNHTIKLQYEKEVNNEELDIEDRIKLSEKFFLDNKKLLDTSSDKSPIKTIIFNNNEIRVTSYIRNTLSRMGLLSQLRSLYIKFNIPRNLECISIPGNLKIDITDELFSLEGPGNELVFIGDLFESFCGWVLNNNFDPIEALNKDKILEQLKFKEEVIDNLKKYTPIEDIRFNENINIYHDGNLVSIENLKIDFKLNNKWLPWSQLSDGTKRLFYLVAEITNKESGLILVEEPELGIHPHQFNLVMEFLKAESAKKQIIVSTHSPYTLNHLGPDELGNILITYYDEKKGTQIKHLTEQQIKKAQKYMEEVGFFSDYWMLSDLE